MRHLVRGMVPATLVLVLAACSQGGTAPAPSSDTRPSTASSASASAAPAHWTYQGEEGPAHWGTLDPAYTACADGSAQSPIDVTSPVPTVAPDPVIAYKAGSVKIVNNGHTIEAEAPDGNTVTIDGTSYTLKQVHMHVPSEHKVNGQSFPAEYHFVNKDANGAITVVGLLVQQGASDNAAWAPFVAAATTQPGGETETELDWPALLPGDLTSYRYAGSLTTPPCTEGVHWVLLETPIELSAAQIAALQKAYDGNARPTQPLNGRQVTLDSAK
jgi:carbonic anhydrase